MKCVLQAQKTYERNEERKNCKRGEKKRKPFHGVMQLGTISEWSSACASC
jgi:hypothetical protein